MCEEVEMYSLIIVEYSSIVKTIECIRQYSNMINDWNFIHPIIVDNSPSREAIQVLEKKFGKATKVENLKLPDVFSYDSPYGKIIYCYVGENLGYAKGNNLGTEIADKLYSDEFYIISNNDVVLKDVFDCNVIKKIFDEKLDVAVIGPRVIGLDGKEQSPHKKANAFSYLITNYWFKLWPFRWKVDYDYTGVSKYCYRVMGSFMIIRAKAFCEAGRFDPKTFMFAEEMILSERLVRINYKNYFYNDITVVHEHGASVKKAATAIRSEQWAFESCCYYFKTYRGTSKMLISFAKLNFEVYKLQMRFRIFVKKIIGLIKS